MSRLDEEFVSGLKEFVPFVCNDATDDTSQCPTIKIDPMAERMTADDFIDQVFKTSMNWFNCVFQSTKYVKACLTNVL